MIKVYGEVVDTGTTWTEVMELIINVCIYVRVSNNTFWAQQRQHWHTSNCIM